jgi:hypothetical protein
MLCSNDKNYFFNNYNHLLINKYINILLDDLYIFIIIYNQRY